MYPSTSLFVAVGQLAIVVLVLFSYPLQVLPCRNCLDKVFQSGTAAVEMDDMDDMDDVDEHSGSEMSPLKHTLLTTAIVGIGFGIAYFVDDLQIGKCLPMILAAVQSDPISSALPRWVHGIHDGLVYSPRAVLLEGMIAALKECKYAHSILLAYARRPKCVQTTEPKCARARCLRHVYLCVLVSAATVLIPIRCI